MKLTVISTAYFNLLHAIFKQQKTYPREYGGIDIEHIFYPRQRTTPPKRSVHLFYGTNETRESLLGQCVNRCHMCWECHVRCRKNTIQQILVSKVNSVDVGIRVVRTFLFCFTFLFVTDIFFSISLSPHSNISYDLELHLNWVVVYCQSVDIYNIR
jgi:hypothetical protein